MTRRSLTTYGAIVVYNLFTVVGVVLFGWPVQHSLARLVRERHVRHCRGAGQWTFAAGVEAHRRANSGRSVGLAD